MKLPAKLAVTLVAVLTIAISSCTSDSNGVSSRPAPPAYPFVVANPSEPRIHLDESFSLPPKEKLLDLYFITRIWAEHCRLKVPPEVLELHSLMGEIAAQPEDFYPHAAGEEKKALVKWWKDLDWHMKNSDWSGQIDAKKIGYFNAKGKSEVCNQWDTELLKYFLPDFVDNE